MIKKLFEPLLPFFERTQRLCYIERCSNTPHIRPYSVAQHSYYIALYAMVFADLENHRRARCTSTIPIEENYDMGEVLKMALLHDMEEAETGDILYPLHNEHFAFKEALVEARDEVVKSVVFQELPLELRNHYIRLWRVSKADTREGQLVACMDKFEILMFAIHELKMGNMAFSDLYSNAKSIIKHEFNIVTVREVIAEIEDIFG